jgi:TetR/AcrR family transcriptional regulator, regulator of biofilm formation and stress response
MGTEPLPQRKPQRRGIERRTAILQATLRILGRDGSAAITHRLVADEAGVPIAATTYYFSSKEDLLREALYLHAKTEAQRVADATQTLGNTPSIDHLADRLADFLDYGLNVGRTTLIAEYELLLQAARHPELEPLSRVFYDEIRGQLEEPLKELGSTDAEGVARLIMAALAGLEVDNLATPTTRLPRQELRRLIGRLLHALLAVDPDA